MERKLRITVEGHEYIVTVEDLTEGSSLTLPSPGSMYIPNASPASPTAPAMAAPSTPARAAAAAGDVTTTLGGVVESLAVVVGQTVNQGDVIAVIEAMKMKAPMVAHCGGKIAAIHVKVGEAVEVGRPLATIA